MDSQLTQFLTETIVGLNPLVQFLAVFAVGLVPYLESHVGALVGTVVGIPIPLALLAAIVGNLLALGVALWAGRAVARRVAARRGAGSGKRSQKVLAKVDQFGIPLASLLGPFVLATALSTFIMVGAGLNQRKVMIWQAAAVVIWGIAFGVIGLGVRGTLV
ncbi:steroid 5-alpha reductase family enzyme [Crossiella equi]|uniref:Steroid 5-alpha reductase family enzyme n=1 Tax=Crossiella equi TaxID=130796 RepID=A0ABS5ASF3_9PSEU|nr:hypothetical protein [Crossiella equi]MBP2479501.1 steroid 5-alpha reductase family enzyme [Crossiella equi]